MTNKRVVAIVAVIIILFLGIFAFANTGEENTDNGNNNNDNQNIIDENQDEEDEKEGTNTEEEEGQETTRPTRMSADTTNPVIKLNGDAEVYIDLGTDYVELGAKVTDNRDNDKEATISGNVDNSKAGIYTLTYTATDAAGNAAKPVTRIVKVRPIISIVGNKFNHTMGKPFTPFQAGFSSDLNESSTLIDPSSNSVNPNKPGKYYLVYTGNANEVDATSKTITIVVVDEEDPEIDSVEKDPIREWSNTDVKVTVNASDNDEVTEYSFDGGTSWQEENFKTFGENTTLQIIVKDASGRTSAVTNEEVKIDREVPTIDTNVSASIQAGVYTHEEMLAFVTLSDEGGAGIDLSSVTYDGSNSGYIFNTLGSKTLVYSVKDNAENPTTESITFEVIDTVGPTCEVTKTSDAEWTNDHFTLVISASDNYGLHMFRPYNFGLGNGSFVGWESSNTKDYYNEGIRTIDVKVRDRFSNGSNNICSSIEIKIDKTSPVTSYDGSVYEVRLDKPYTNSEMVSFAKMSDALSGISEITYGGSSNGYTFTTLGDQTLTYVATDKANNQTTIDVNFNVYQVREYTFEATNKYSSFSRTHGSNARVEVSQHYNHHYRNVTITPQNGREISNYEIQYTNYNYRGFSDFNSFVASSYSSDIISFTLNDFSNDKATIYFEDILGHKYLVKVELD